MLDKEQKFVYICCSSFFVVANHAYLDVYAIFRLIYIASYRV